MPRLRTDAWVSAPREQVFPFFADAVNLQVLTPPWLHFAIRSPEPIAMHQGTRIAYSIRLHGIPVPWVSEITAWQPPDRFVDEQRRGPYRRWAHTHRFASERAGTRLTDDVQFDVLFGWLVGPLVRRDLVRIFTYRHHALMRVFDQPKPWPEPRVQIDL
jgi:ligand-binding SRPBCC domain-containing protein